MLEPEGCHAPRHVQTLLRHLWAPGHVADVLLHEADISIDAEGYVVDIAPNDGQCDHSVGVLLPAMGNVHSHSFQRAMAGLAERRGPTAIDDFWI